MLLELLLLDSTLKKLKKLSKLKNNIVKFPVFTFMRQKKKKKMAGKKSLWQVNF